MKNSNDLKQLLKIREMRVDKAERALGRAAVALETANQATKSAKSTLNGSQKDLKILRAGNRLFPGQQLSAVRLRKLVQEEHKQRALIEDHTVMLGQCVEQQKKAAACFESGRTALHHSRRLAIRLEASLEIIAKQNAGSTEQD